MKHNLLRRAFTLVLTLCMAFSLIIVASADETEPASKVALGLQLSRTGSTVTATVSVDENTANFKDLQAKVTFDKDVLEFVSTTAGDTGVDLLFNKTPNEKSALNVVASKEAGYAGTGVLFTAEFTVKEGVTAESTTMAFAADQCMTDVDAVVTVAGEQTVSLVDVNATVSGTVTSFLDEEGEVTVSLFTEGQEEAVAAVTVTGNTAEYSFADVAAGAYTMKVAKANHATRSYDVVIEDAGVTVDAEIYPMGDVLMDGEVNGRDWMRVQEHLQVDETVEGESENKLTGYAYDLANVLPEDNILNSRDWMRLQDHIQEVDPLW